MKYTIQLQKSLSDILQAWFYYNLGLSKEESVKRTRTLMVNDSNFLKATVEKFFSSFKIDNLDIILRTNKFDHESTKGMIIATNIEADILLSPGYSPRIIYPNVVFKHGHLKPDGSIACTGSYKPPIQQALDNGLSSMLVSLYSFARYSAHDTALEENEEENED